MEMEMEKKFETTISLNLIQQKPHPPAEKNPGDAGHHGSQNGPATRPGAHHPDLSGGAATAALVTWWTILATGTNPWLSFLKKIW